MSHDPSPRVRRAAVLVVEKMITGLGKSCLEVRMIINVQFSCNLTVTTITTDCSTVSARFHLP